MTSKHTPGPWKVGMLKDRGKYAGCTFIEPASGPGFAFLPPGREDVQKANARLIAEAPAMLDELSSAAKTFREVAELPSAGPGASTSCRMAAIHIEAFLSRIGGEE